jgi:hypothetical protein
MSGRADTIRKGLGPRWAGRAPDSLTPEWQAAQAGHVELDALVAENQRLRDALERIGDDRDPLNGYRGAGDFARSTLAGTPNEDTR